MTIEPPVKWGSTAARQLDALYERDFDALVQFVMAVGRLPRVAAEDVAQEAFVRMMKHPPRDWHTGPAWLRTTALRLSVDAARAAERQREKAEKMEFTGPAASPSAEESVLSNWELATVREALAGLSEFERQALRLRYAGYSYREIGQSVGVKEGQVGVFLLRAMKKLRQAYLEQMSSEGGQKA